MGLTLAFCSTVTGFAAAAMEPQVLFNFQAGLGTVTSPLAQGLDGNFYGTTAHGGPSGGGTIFRVTPTGVLTTLVTDQANPAGLIVGNDNLLYGMMSSGGPFASGTAFKMTTSGILTNFGVLNGINGRTPLGNLVLAGDGNFYGTSQGGGTNDSGAVFRITPAGVVTLLVSFNAVSNGAFPLAGLTLGPEGNLYGITAFLGGMASKGTIFKVTPAGSLTTLHSFQAEEGTGRQARLTLGPDGNLYGTSQDGGIFDLGTVFRITTNGVFTTLVSFNRANGAVPFAELTSGPDGQLYGTTQQGGSANVGTVFKVTTNGALTTLASFTSAANGMPQSGLLLASNGNFSG